MSTKVVFVTFYFSKKSCKGKIKFWSVNADTKMLMSRFPNGL